MGAFTPTLRFMMMKIMFSLCAFLLATVFSHCTFAAPARYASLQAYFAATPHARVDESQVAKGDLNGDGREDMALMLATGATREDRRQQLVVLLQETDGSFTLAVASGPEPLVGMGCCWVEALEIKNQSVFIQNNAKTACTMEAATHQFKLYKNVWRAVGVNIFYVKLCDEPQTETTQSFNLLTGKLIVTTAGGKKPVPPRTRSFTPSVARMSAFDFNNGFGLPLTR
jgi:hypothetical protein